MSWFSSGISGNPNWIVTNTFPANPLGSTAISVKDSLPSTSLYTLEWRDTPRQFLTTKTYLYKTEIREIGGIYEGMSFSVSNEWGDNLIISSQSFQNDALFPLVRTSPFILEDFFFTWKTGYFYYYSKPISNTFTNKYFTYRANSNFGLQPITQEPGIKSVDIYEINWDINGFMYCDDGTFNFSTQSHSLGWKFLNDLYNFNASLATQSAYIWFDSDSSPFYPIGGNNGSKIAHVNYREINFISKLVNYQYFNLYFEYTKMYGNPSDGIRLYLSDTPPPKTTSISSFDSFTNSSVLIAEINDLGNLQASFYGLQGGQYITIVANKTTASNSLIVIRDLKLEGGYHPGNNEIYQMTLPNLTTSIPGATFTALVGNGNTINSTQSLIVNEIYGKIGNGIFKSGVWENGVWNNGWREDESVADFDNIDISIRSLSDVRWRWRIIGPSASVEKFSVGDIVSVGNIIGIDINENRKLLKNAFQIISASASGINERIGYIIIESDTTFPFMNVKKDSVNHKIKVTKNVWLSGAFLNGYFTGVWNYGLFRGYPLITEMYDTHWIDGRFEGGHFNSENFTYPEFVDTVFSDGRVGLTFSQPHKLAAGDTITINKDNKSINPQYDGETTVKEVISDYYLITNLPWGQNTSNESGRITTDIHSSVIQNMNFESQNISNVTSNVSLESPSVFIYNSWMDLQYDNTSATNIGKPQSLINDQSKKSYSENNLYGYITRDVLSSNSSFRDSFSSNVRRYKLGTKYKIFSDYIGDSGRFDNYFDPASSATSSQLFLDQGWTFSWSNVITTTFSRTTDIGQEFIVGKELKVDAYGPGSVLDLQSPNFNVNNRDITGIEKNRYTIIKFDLLTYSVVEDTTPGNVNGFYKTINPGPGWYFGKSGGIYEPLIHFNNINKISRDITLTNPISGVSSVYSQDFPANFLPIYQNINHLKTPKKTKIEYFYNKTNLGMHFRGNSIAGIYPSQFIIDNLNFYEVDMVPFFQYFTEENINIGVQVPLQGIAPFIDYGFTNKATKELFGSDSNFVYLDNTVIGLDSFDITTQFGVYSGVGIGINSSVETGGIFNPF